MVQTETADYFAKALERCWHAGGARDRSGTGVWITIQDTIPIMLRRLGIGCATWQGRRAVGLPRADGS